MVFKALNGLDPLFLKDHCHPYRSSKSAFLNTGSPDAVDLQFLSSVASRTHVQG